MHSRPLIALGDRTFDPESGEVRGPAGVVRLEPQPARVLDLLASRPGEVVTREEIRQAVWADTAIEADQSINYCVRRIRQALGESKDGEGLLETLPRRGYRLRIGPPLASPAPGPRRRGALVAAGVLAVVALVALAARFRNDGPIRIAILPLATAGDSGWTVAANRDLTERLVAAFTAVDSGRLAIVGPATTAAVPTRGRPQSEVGRELRVAFVVSGGIRERDSTLFVQMIRVSDSAHVFAWRRPLNEGDWSELARSVADGASVRLAPDTPPATPPAATRPPATR